MLFPFMKGSILNLRDAEQGLENIQQLSSYPAQMEFIPGSKLEQTKLIIKHPVGKPWKAAFHLDNSGANKTGDTNLSGNINFENLLLLREFLSVDFQTIINDTVKENVNQSQSFKYKVPFGYFLYSLLFTEFRYKTKIQNIATELYNSGSAKSQITSVAWTIPWLRRQNRKSTLSYSYKQRQSKNYFGPILLKSSSRNIKSHAISFGHYAQILGASVNFDLKYYTGALSKVEGIENSEDEPDLRWHKTSLGLVVDLPFSMPLASLFRKTQEKREVKTRKPYKWSISLQGQKSKDRLFSSEQFGIGGLHSIRSFNGESLSGDEGFFVRNEFSRTFVLRKKKVQHKLFFAYDTGNVRSKALMDDMKQESWKALSGVAIGLSSQSNLIGLELSYAKPLQHPSYFTAKPVLWFSSSLRF